MTKTHKSPEYSVVVPVYNSDSSVRELVERLRRVFDETVGASWQIVLVDDGSSLSTTWPTCEELVRKEPRVEAIRLMRNYGKPGAVLCGLERARGQWVITIDDDLQQRPEDIPTLLPHRGHDVVVANFKRRRHSSAAIAASWLKGRFDRMILGLPCKMSPLKLFKAEVAAGMLRVRTAHPFIPALMAQVTTDFFEVKVDHHESRLQASRYTFMKRLRQLSNLLLNNSNLMLRALGGIGGLVALSGFALAIFLIVRRLGLEEVVPGWTSLIVINLIFGGLILIGLGIIGEYLIRVLEGVSERPAYLVREAVSEGVVQRGDSVVATEGP